MRDAKSHLFCLHGRKKNKCVCATDSDFAIEQSSFTVQCGAVRILFYTFLKQVIYEFQ